jgi:hypothetical protein
MPVRDEGFPVKNFCQISIDINMERVVKSATNEPGGPMSGLQDSKTETTKNRK